jgi:hypothetical protein
LIPFVYYKILKREKPDLETFDDEETITIQLEFQNKSKKMKLLPNPKMAPKRVLPPLSNRLARAKASEC